MTTTGQPSRAGRNRPSVDVRGESDPGLAPSLRTEQFPEPNLGEKSTEPFPPLTEQEIAEIEARGRANRDHWERVYQALRMDALSCARSMRSSPLLSAESWTEVVDRSLDDYRSGRSLMDHMGADRLVDPALTGMLLAIRRGLIEEIHSPTMADFVLIDMAVIAFANAMRLQSIVGNTALITEGELFGQPTLRARWKNQYGGRPEDIRGLAVDEHVTRLREVLMPLIERFNAMGGDAIDRLRRQREAPSTRVERARPLEIKVMIGDASTT